MSGEKVIAEFRKLFEGIDVPLDISLVERQVPFLEPYVCSPEEPFIRTFLNSLSHSLVGHGTPEMERSPEIIYGASVGDYNIFGNLLPTIVYGPRGQFHHSANEFVNLESVRSAHEKLKDWISNLS